MVSLIVGVVAERAMPVDVGGFLSLCDCLVSRDLLSMSSSDSE